MSPLEGLREGQLVDLMLVVPSHDERPDAEDDDAPFDIMQLEGLGAEIWRDPDTGEPIDAQEYVNQERASWGG